MIAIIPVDPCLNMFLIEGKVEFCPDQGGEVEEHKLSQTNILFRAPRMTKIFKILRFIRMVKIFKLIKSSDSLSSNFSQRNKITTGFNRLSLLLGMIMYGCHIMSCFWIFIGNEGFNQGGPNGAGWLHSDNDLGPWLMYLKAFYFIVTTMTTVGYGDMSGGTPHEHIFCILLMLFGVFAFSMITGTLASVLSQMDSETAELTEKLMFLNKIQEHYSLPQNIVDEIRKSLNYDSVMAMRGLNEFIEDLPPQLKTAVAVQIHKPTFTNDPYFKRLANNRMLSFVG